MCEVRSRCRQPTAARGALSFNGNTPRERSGLLTCTARRLDIRLVSVGLGTAQRRRVGDHGDATTRRPAPRELRAAESRAATARRWPPRAQRLFWRRVRVDRSDVSAWVSSNGSISRASSRPYSVTPAAAGGVPTTIIAGAVDADHDGVSPPTDCDDANASIHPGATDICGDVRVRTRA
ncbi:putative metal-binding motif-containing protein [Solirubrobacter ginsenosidimutans]|uniref:putative metal-binding motif-containing protein n=1 Tax=Solirubrobacter ginsenosidimutans TaxID=490573 RepID=UPI003557BA75